MKNTWSFLCLALFLLLAGGNTMTVHSQVVEYRICFPVGKSDLEASFQQNSSNLEQLRQLLAVTKPSSIDSIVIRSTSSPDGPLKTNCSLSTQREHTIMSFMKTEFPEYSPLMRPSNICEDWKGFRSLVQKDSMLAEDQRSNILKIIDSDIPTETKKSQLQQLDTYEYLTADIFPYLRTSGIRVYMSAQSEPETAGTMPEEPQAVTTVPPTPETAEPEPLTEQQTTAAPQNDKKEIFYLRTNFLSPLTNFGAEYCIDNNWSVAADYYFPWFFRNRHNRNCFQLLGWNIEGRYWFGKDRSEEDRLEGHSIGLSASAGYYDFEREYKGKQGEFVSAGVDYLFSLPIADDRLHLEFTLGLGYIWSYVKPYNVFEDGGKAYKTGYTERFNWWGPTKAGVSLVVPIKCKRRAER